MNLSNVLATLETEPKFLTFHEILARIDGLASTFAGSVHIDTIGTTAEGRPLRMLTVGNGTRDAVVIGMPHPNEPTGALGALQLAAQLCRDKRLRDDLGLRWHIIPCADPDGTVLNESWFTPPVTLEHYASRLYRPPLSHDFEWTFHRNDLTEPGMPSTHGSRAVMHLLDELKPELLVSMHNAESGGLYAYASRAGVPLAPGFHQASSITGIPIDHGFAEAPADIITPGLFLSEPQLTGGGAISSTDYAGQFGTYSVVIEPPLWLADRVDNTALSGTTADELFSCIETERRLLRNEYARWRSAVNFDALAQPARWAAVQAGAEQLNEAWESLTSESRILTVAEVSSVLRMRDLERMRLVGHLIAALTSSTSSQSPLVLANKQLVQQLHEVLTGWANEAESGAFCGTDASVAAHVGVALAAASALRSQS